MNLEEKTILTNEKIRNLIELHKTFETFPIKILILRNYTRFL